MTAATRTTPTPTAPGVPAASPPGTGSTASPAATTLDRRSRIALLIGLAVLLAAPFIGLYPVFMMKALCFAIFACAFNLLLGYTGLLSFGHAAYFGARPM